MDKSRREARQPYPLSPFLLVAPNRPLGPNVIHVCLPCLQAAEPEAPRSCIICRSVMCQHETVCRCKNENANANDRRVDP